MVRARAIRAGEIRADQRYRPRSSGFTLIETVIVIVLLGIVSTAVLMHFTNISKSPVAVITNQAVALAQAGVEEILADKKIGGFSSIPTGTTTESPVDATYFPSFTRTTTVYYVDAPALDTDINPSTSLWKRVSVTVAGSGGVSITLVTVISEH